jgi:FixJ family two-component response regulator
MPDSDSVKEIFVADDDCTVLRALQVMLGQAGFTVAVFPDGHTLLEAARSRTPACVLLDVCMPELPGLEVIGELTAQGFLAPVIMMSGSATIPLAVEAIRRGAFDMVRKPFDIEQILIGINNAITAYEGVLQRRQQIEHASSQIARGLTPRERDVMKAITEGLSNKETAIRLHISPRTVEIYRSRVNAKLGARNGADLARIVINANRAG